MFQINALPGLYTECLKECIVISGFEARKMFHRVGQIVLQLSDGDQHPVRSIFDLLKLDVSPLCLLSRFTHFVFVVVLSLIHI